MSKRLVVTPNIEEVTSLVEGKGWSKAYFSETVMKKSRGWITEWKRAKNFPCPEEAVHMCAMLQTTPEEILTEQADIELVRGLLEQEREKGIKKTPSRRMRPKIAKPQNSVEFGVLRMKMSAVICSKWRVC